MHHSINFDFAQTVNCSSLTQYSYGEILSPGEECERFLADEQQILSRLVQNASDGFVSDL